MKKLFWGSAAVLWVSGTAVFADPSVVVSTLPVSVDNSTPVSASSGVCLATASWRQVPNTAFPLYEDLRFVIKWGVITGGYSSLSVQGIERVDGRDAYHLVEEAKSSGFVDTFYKVRDRHDIWLDVQSLTTLRYDKKVREGSYRIEESVILDQVCHRYKLHSFRVDKNTYEDKEGPIPPDVLDPLGSLYYVRNIPLEPGQTYSVDVHSGEKVYPLVVSVKKRERVKVPAGKFDTLLVEPLLRGPGVFISKGKKLEVWLTDDARRMPVKMRSEVFIGHVSAELVEFHSSQTPQ